MVSHQTELLDRAVKAYDALKKIARPMSKRDREIFDNLQVEDDGSFRQLLPLTKPHDPSETLNMGIWLKPTSTHTGPSTEFVRFVVWQDSTDAKPTRKYIAIEFHARKNRWILVSGATYDHPFFLRLFQDLDVTFHEVQVLDEARALSVARKIKESFAKEGLAPS